MLKLIMAFGIVGVISTDAFAQVEGKLHITATPNAYVRLSTRQTVTTPSTLTLPIGYYVLTFSAVGYQSQEIAVIVSEEPLQVHATLERDQAWHQIPSPSVVDILDRAYEWRFTKDNNWGVVIASYVESEASRRRNVGKESPRYNYILTNSMFNKAPSDLLPSGIKRVEQALSEQLNIYSLSNWANLSPQPVFASLSPSEKHMLYVHQDGDLWLVDLETLARVSLGVQYPNDIRREVPIWAKDSSGAAFTFGTPPYQRRVGLVNAQTGQFSDLFPTIQRNYPDIFTVWLITVSPNLEYLVLGSMEPGPVYDTLVVAPSSGKMWRIGMAYSRDFQWCDAERLLVYNPFYGLLEFYEPFSTPKLLEGFEGGLTTPAQAIIAPDCSYLLALSTLDGMFYKLRLK